MESVTDASLLWGLVDYSVRLMTLGEYRAKIRGLINALPTESSIIFEQNANDLIASIENRSINDGIEVAGAKQNYSTNQVNTQRFKGKELNQKGRSYIASNRLGTWADFRKAQGLQAENVNLAYSNKMWSSLRLGDISNNNGRISGQIVFSDSEGAKKFEQNIKRYGNFFSPNSSEKSDFKDNVTSDLVKVIKKYLAI